MQLIKKEKLNKIIEESFDYVFNIKKDGLYLIEIVASARSWWQNFKKLTSFFKDDNLAVIIDKTDFPKLSGKRGLFDAEASWNGNNLKGLKKTNLFFLPLSAGNHAIKFLVKQKPTLASIVISKIEEHEKQEQIVYVPTINNPAQDGDRRQWVTVIALDTDIRQFTIKARAGKMDQDDDDIKLIIDSEIQKNKELKSHTQWFWCGRTLDNKDKIFTKNLNLKKGLHYFEFWADKTPYIYRIEIATKDEQEKNTLEKRIPTVDDPKWTGNFNDDTEQMILARVVWGEARDQNREARIAVAWSIKNRLGTTSAYGLRDTYHKIILEPSQYSVFWEKPPDDANLEILKDPLGTTDNMDDHKKWRETHKIAGQVINSEIDDPVGGANHYYDDSIAMPSWATQENLVRKIGRIFFHRL